MSKNSNLHAAKAAKNDEFYTLYSTVEKEVEHYVDQLKDQWIYCPCDDYRWSNFVKYFKDNFDRLKLKRLTATNYNIGDGAWRYDYDGVEEKIIALEGNGDFRSEECTQIKNECDVIVTNPPFSLMNNFVYWLYDGKFELNNKGEYIKVKNG